MCIVRNEKLLTYGNKFAFLVKNYITIIIINI